MEFFHTYVSEKSRELVKRVLEEEWLSEGKRVKQFESELTKKLGLINPIAVNSGTSALHLALSLAEIKKEDEVILPPQTFISTGLAIKMQGAIPVFADINPNTGNISPRSIEEKITEKTKAIMPVDWSGYPCDLNEINSIANKYNLSVIEDAAHALGATYKGKPLGSISRFTIFSFQAVKQLTTGDGGALCCINEEDAKKGFIKRWFGIDREKSKPSLLGEREYDVTEIGYKYHMNDVAAAIGLGNLEEYTSRLKKRQEIAGYYRDELKDLSGIKLLELKKDRTHAYYLFTMLVDERENFIRKLKEKGVPSSVVHLRIDKNSLFGGITKNLMGQEYFNEKQVAIPVHDGLNQEQIEYIVKTIKSGW